MSSQGKRGPRGGVYDPFPIKLHRMLGEAQAADLESVVSWHEHGRSFRIHQPKVFAETIMCRYFNQSKYTSFQRQLNLYGFSRCVGGAYQHPSFLRGKPALALGIIRTKIKGTAPKRRKPREGHFYKTNGLKNDNSTVSFVNSRTSVVAPVSPNPSVQLSSVGSPPSDGSVQYGNSTHVDEINETIFIHELAMGCTILCKLRQDKSKL